MSANSDTEYQDTEYLSDQYNGESDVELNTEDVDDEDTIDVCDLEDIMTEDVDKPIITVDKKDRIAKNQLTSKEANRLIGTRTLQLTKGAKKLIKENPKTEKLTYEEIAIEEIKLNTIPLKIRRYIDGHYEIWEIDELNKKHLLHLLK